MKIILILKILIMKTVLTNNKIKKAKKINLFNYKL